MDDIHALLPQDKCDLERARALVALGYPAVVPVLPELMVWLQDMNWPVAEIVAPFLATIGLPLVPHIRQVLATDDEAWKMWVMQELSSHIKESRYFVPTCARTSVTLCESVCQRRNQSNADASLTIAK